MNYADRGAMARKGDGEAPDRRPPLPFLRWPGGKKWLLEPIRAIVADVAFSRYIEPFLGGGSIYFGLQRAPAILSDINEELINAYVQVRDRPMAVQRELLRIRVDRATYDQIRSLIPASPVKRAARLIYLNRTAFSGIYRVNQQGQFNVPFGGGARTPEFLGRRNLLARASQALSGQTILCRDFEEALAGAGRCDLVYADPTYSVRHNNNGFLRYNERIFSWADQIRLANACIQASHRGAFVIVSNAHHPAVRDLYGGAIARVQERASLLAPSAASRSRTKEYLFVLKPRGRRPGVAT